MLLLENSFLINLTILTGGVMYFKFSYGESRDITLVYVSIGIAFIKFRGIIIWSIVQVLLCCRNCQLPYDSINESTQSQHYERRETIQVSDQLRGSFLDDSQQVPT